MRGELMGTSGMLVPQGQSMSSIIAYSAKRISRDRYRPRRVNTILTTSRRWWRVPQSDLTSMAEQWKSTCPFVTLRSPSPPTDLSPSSTPAFRFNDLPGEVRNKIYRLCLINESPIALEVLEVFVSDPKMLEGTGIPEKEPLVFFSRDSDIEKWTVNGKLLRVSKAIREEAASIFYGCNRFQFLRPQSLIHFLYFESNLTDVAYRHVRCLEVGFPTIKRTVLDGDVVSQFSVVGDRGLQVLVALPRLEDVTFHLRGDLMKSDIWLLRRICGSCWGCRVALSLGDVEVYDRRRPYSRRAVRISSEAREGMREWGWEVKGRYIEVDRHHEWRNEHQWLEALQESTRWGLEHGLIHEPKFWPKTHFFRLAGLSI